MPTQSKDEFAELVVAGQLQEWLNARQPKTSDDERLMPAPKRTRRKRLTKKCRAQNGDDTQQGHGAKVGNAPSQESQEVATRHVSIPRLTLRRARGKSIRTSNNPKLTFMLWPGWTPTRTSPSREEESLGSSPKRKRTEEPRESSPTLPAKRTKLCGGKKLVDVVPSWLFDDDDDPGLEERQRRGTALIPAAKHTKLCGGKKDDDVVPSWLFDDDDDPSLEERRRRGTCLTPAVKRMKPSILKKVGTKSSVRKRVRFELPSSASPEVEDDNSKKRKRHESGPTDEENRDEECLPPARRRKRAMAVSNRTESSHTLAASNDTEDLPIDPALYDLAPSGGENTPVAPETGDFDFASLDYLRLAVESDNAAEAPETEQASGPPEVSQAREPVERDSGFDRSEIAHAAGILQAIVESCQLHPRPNADVQETLRQYMDYMPSLLTRDGREKNPHLAKNFFEQVQRFQAKTPGFERWANVREIDSLRFKLDDLQQFEIHAHAEPRRTVKKRPEGQKDEEFWVV
ncbi:hypothetical protein G7046_g7256 [Stylonectria norvegica]|nr:hypothetical protein G7046_g7256 [Stylonectria norvegica]